MIFIADLAPGAVGARNYHPGPEFFYVLEGTLAHEPEGGSAHMMRTGAFGSNHEQRSSHHQEPQRDGAGEGYRFPGRGKGSANRHTSKVARTLWPLRFNVACCEFLTGN